MSSKNTSFTLFLLAASYAFAANKFAVHNLVADTPGVSESTPIGPEMFARPLGTAARLLVTSRPHSPFAAALAAAVGRPFAVLDPTTPLPWYQPPAGE